MLDTKCTVTLYNSHMEDTIIEFEINPGRERIEEWIKEYVSRPAVVEHRFLYSITVDDFVRWLNDTKNIEVSMYGSDHAIEFPI